MSTAKFKLGVIGTLAVVAVASLFVMQHQALIKSREENRTLQQQLDELAKLAEDHRRLSNLVAQTDSRRGLAEEQFGELLKLRGEVGRLRQANNASADLEREIQQLRPLAAAKQAKELSLVTMKAMQELGRAARAFLADHGDQFPTNFSQFHDLLPAKLPGDLPLDAFEFVPSPAKEDSNPYLLLFRERLPRQTDGKWARVYCHADGSVVERISEDGNYDKWETNTQE
jgi:hypothetical protein